MEWISVKVWASTYKLARIIAAVQGVPLGKLFHRLLTEEAERLGLEV